MEIQVIDPIERSVAEALALAPALLADAEAERAPRIAASVVRGPAIALGALQRAGRVVDVAACAAAGTAVYRRATTGTAVYLGARAIVWTLALPHVAALVPDATARTLLNRNVRGFLDGLRRAGALAHYFGREWISVQKRPAAVLAFEALPSGAVVIEVIAGVDAPIALPAALASAEERAIDRWRGKAPASLVELLGPDVAPDEVARVVASTVAARATPPIAPGVIAGVAPRAPITRDDDPLPEGFTPGPLIEVPIGRLDTASSASTGEPWIGGDVLAPTFALRAIAAAVGRGEAPSIGDDLPIDGATAADLARAAEAARIFF